MADKSVPTKGGGPKSLRGLAASSRNALTHGLRGLSAVNERENLAMVTQIAQLTEHYRPHSPLEHLQIQRIARCAVKLESLYAIEQAKADLAILKAQASDDQIMAHFGHYPASARDLAMQQLMKINAPPPFNLTDDKLNALCREFEAFTGLLDSEADLNKAFPKLRKYLQSTEIEGYTGPFSMDHRLWAVASWLKSNMLDKAPTANPAELEGGIEELLRRVGAKGDFTAGLLSGLRPPARGQSYEARVRDDFRVFLELRQCRRQAREIVDQFAPVKELVMASTTMPGEDSDRLMRYQTALERQLSRYVGELLQLHSLQPPR